MNLWVIILTTLLLTVNWIRHKQINLRRSVAVWCGGGGKAQNLPWLMLKDMICTITSGSRTVLYAVLQVVYDSSQDGGQTHDLSTLRQPQSEELVPAGTNQTGVTVLTETHRHAGSDRIPAWSTVSLCVSRMQMRSPKCLECWNGACPVHGEEEQARCRFTDVVHIQVLWHGAGHR